MIVLTYPAGEDGVVDLSVAPLGSRVGGRRVSTDAPDGFRWCRLCDRELPEDRFGLHRDGRRLRRYSWCDECRSRRAALHYRRAADIEAVWNLTVTQAAKFGACPHCRHEFAAGDTVTATVVDVVHLGCAEGG